MKIVVVEDNISLQSSIAEVLTHEGHQVQCFADGLTAYQFIVVERNSIDVAIIDYMLPKLDGVSLIARLRAEGVTLPMLMLTARDSVSDKVSGLESGADYYLTKPFEFAELLACLKALYRRPPKYQSEQVALSEAVSFDPQKKQLHKAGEIINLTPAEAGILEYLVRHRGEVCSQQTIYDAVFDFAKENWSNTVEVHIKNLRKKLSHKSYENPIKTIRSVGYCLEY